MPERRAGSRMSRNIRRMLMASLAVVSGGLGIGADWSNPERMVMAAADEKPIAPDRDNPLPPPRDPNIAVREEYDLAVAAGTVAALDLFIRRHGDHPLADLAKRERDRLAAEGK